MTALNAFTAANAPALGSAEMDRAVTIKGVSPYGPTAQTIALSTVLAENAEARAELRAMLDMIEAPWTHSGCEGDRRAALAATLADMVRCYKGAKIY